MTPKLNFPDLTKINTPVLFLDDDTLARMRAWAHGVERLTTDGQWLQTKPAFNPGTTYRACPAPLEPDYVDWSQVAAPFNWHARDEDGAGAFYEYEPQQGRRTWRQIEGDYVPSHSHASYRRGTVDWRDSLISRLEVEG